MRIYFVPAPARHICRMDLKGHSKGFANWTDIESITHIKRYRICTLYSAMLIASENIKYICRRTLIAFRIFHCNTENVSDTILNYPKTKNQKIWSTFKGIDNQKMPISWCHKWNFQEKSFHTATINCGQWGKINDPEK